jgi:hypothetical protein
MGLKKLGFQRPNQVEDYQKEKNGNYFPFRPISTGRIEERNGWHTFLRWLSSLLQPFELYIQDPRCKKRPAKEQEEIPFFHTIMLSKNRSIYDDFHNNRHVNT